jgi:murein DD-endopeptidase MepM/ murein hydrolase activator NlpD
LLRVIYKEESLIKIMRKLSINLPPKYRLEVKLTKSRELADVPLVPNLGKILRARKGSRFSRFFIHIFEHKKAKKVLPIYFAAIIAGSAYMPIPVPSVRAADEIAVSNHLEMPVLETRSGIRYPVDTIRITQGYNIIHGGIDLDGITGDPIYPMALGKVEAIEHSRFAYGESIIINHGNGLSTRYAHLSKIEVTVGQQVDMNTIIGKMGSTGRSFGDHLHFEVYQDGKTINPFTLLPKNK